MRRLVLILSALLLATEAAAYVLPSSALLELLEKRRGSGSTRTRRVEGTLTLFAPDGDRQVAPAVHDVELNGRCRMEIVAGQWEGAFSAWDGGRIREPETTELEDLARLVALACPFVAVREDAARQIRAALQSHGVDLHYTGLSRLNGEPAYLIGARPWEADRPQLWLDKDSLQPVKFVGKALGRLAEVRMLGYADPATGSLHPHTMELWLDGRIRLRFSAERLEQGLRFPKGHFR